MQAKHGAADLEGELGPARGAQVGDDDAAACDAGAIGEQAHHRLIVEVVRHLADQHQVHASVGERERTGAAEERRDPGTPGESCRGRNALEPKRAQRNAATRQPVRRIQGEVTGTCSDIEERKCSPPIGWVDEAGQAGVYGGGAAKPAIGACDVAQHPNDQLRVGGGIVESLAADR